MAALNNLSVAANVLQVIGFHADTVFSIGQGLYELLDKARLASQTITLLLHQLQALLSVVALVKIVVDEHHNSAFANEDGHGLPNIQTLLLLIEQDFRHLKSILESTAGPSRLGWLSTLQTSFWWALKDRDVVDARQRLSQYTQQLSAALSAVGRRNDIVFRNKLQSIEDKIQAISQSKVKESSSQGTAVKTTHPKSIVRLPKRPKKLPVSKKERESLKKPSKSHRLTDIAPSYEILEDADCPELGIFEQADKTLVIETGNNELGQFAKALFLLRDSFVSCLSGYRINRVVSINKAQVDHLGMLFDFLVASAHESSAQAIMSKYHNAAHSTLSNRRIEPSGQHQNQYANRTASDHRETKMALYLVEENLTMDTAIGAVHARILSACWSSKTMITLGLEVRYSGHQGLNLSPFAVNYMSHAAIDYSASHSLYSTVTMKGRESHMDKRMLWVPRELLATKKAEFVMTTEAFNRFMCELSNANDMSDIEPLPAEKGNDWLTEEPHVDTISTRKSRIH